MQINFTPFPTIVTERLLLRAITVNDANEIFFLRSNTELLTYLDKAPEKSVEETLSFIESVQKDIENNDSILWGISLKETNIIVGTICYWRIEKQHYESSLLFLTTWITVMHKVICNCRR